MNRNLRIDALKWYGMIGMCLLHGSYLLKDIDIKVPLYTIIQCVGGTALPLYFFLSAFFISSRYDATKIEAKVISRVKSLLIPYLFWQLFCIGAYALLNYLQRKSGLILTHETYVPSKFKEIMYFVMEGYRNPPLWFLCVAMQFVLITPVLIAIVKKYKLSSIIALISCFLGNIIFYEYIEYASVLYWVPVYGAGIWYGIYKPEAVLSNDKKRSYGVCATVVYIIFACILFYVRVTYPQYASQYAYFVWMFMPGILLGISYALPQKELYEGMYDAEFLLFCLHYPLIRWLDALSENFFVPVSDMQILSKCFIIMIAIIILIHISHYMIRKFVRPIYLFLYGKY